ncbi:hypothetical protein KJE20_13213 [Pyrenophora tritici-repentis]|uniref:Uncharacterized protein n=1 Tax=Pyrenophora tritici-repentis TaxID=45151 RepID=A0A922NF39_9PLEO|nr:hypothetical protein Ptr86124_006068 [Pyrenophora tritici-repentis]KAI1677124.1 hypothetical protein KJE20_13213 [Pyrenophora tritici-repentis]
MKFTATLGLFLAALPLVYSHCCYRSDWAPGNQCAGSHDTESGESTHIGVCAKKQREEVQLQRQVKLEEKRVERQRLKEIRELERAEKAAERARKVEAQHQKKATQQAQQRKRKASRAPSSKNKRQKRAMEDRARDRVASPPSPPPPKTTSRGRNVNLPQKFR